MKLYLSRQYSGLYMLTAIKPIKHRVGFSDHEDLYMRVGEPVGYRNMCPASIELLMPGFKHLAPLETCRVEIKAYEIGGA